MSMCYIKNKHLLLQNLFFITCCSFLACSPEDDPDQDIEDEEDGNLSKKKSKKHAKSAAEWKEEAEQGIQNLHKSFFYENKFEGNAAEEIAVKHLLNCIIVNFENDLQNEKTLDYEAIIKHYKKVEDFKGDKISLVFELIKFAEYLGVEEKFVEEFKNEFPLEIYTIELRKLWGANFRYFSFSIIDEKVVLILKDRHASNSFHCVWNFNFSSLGLEK